MGTLNCGKDRDLYRLSVRENAKGSYARRKAIKTMKAKGR